jgi:hypothetical protein
MKLSQRKERDFQLERRRNLLNAYAENAIAFGKVRQESYLNIGGGYN